MRRKILAVLLGVGALSGFSWGFHSLRHHGRWHGEHGGHHGHGPFGHRRGEFEKHVADLCVRAANEAERARGSAAAPKAP